MTTPTGRQVDSAQFHKTLEEYKKLKQDAESRFGTDPVAWIENRIGDWDSSIEVLKALVSLLGAAKVGKLQVGDVSTFLDEGLALVALYSGSKSSDDRLTVVTDSHIESFRLLDQKILAARSNKKRRVAMTEGMMSLISLYVPSGTSASARVTSAKVSFAKFTPGRIDVEVRQGTGEEMILNFAHELAHIEQRRATLDNPQTNREWKLFLGRYLLPIIDHSKDTGPHQAAYSRNILERDADLFARDIGNALNGRRYASAQRSELTSD